jgi:hypothetical protein
MSSDPSNAPLPPDLRFIKALVTTLTAVLIFGLLAIVWLLVTRLGTAPPTLPALPDSVILPPDARPAAVTFARDWLVVVTDAGEVLVYPRAGGAPVSRVTPGP